MSSYSVEIFRKLVQISATRNQFSALYRFRKKHRTKQNPYSPFSSLLDVADQRVSTIVDDDVKVQIEEESSTSEVGFCVEEMEMNRPTEFSLSHVLGGTG